MIHLAGITITVEGRFVRQRCSWCGVLLTDMDLANTMIQEGSGRVPKGWETGAWVRVDGTNPTWYSVVESPLDKFPPGSCLDDVSPVERMP